MLIKTIATSANYLFVRLQNSVNSEKTEADELNNRTNIWKTANIEFGVHVLVLRYEKQY